MFVVEGKQAQAGVAFRKQLEIDSILGHLEGRGYRPVLRSMLAMACEVASLHRSALRIDMLMEPRLPHRRPKLREGLLGDLLFKEDLAYILQPLRTQLHVWEIRPHTLPSSISAFCDDVESSAKKSPDRRRVRRMKFIWRPIKERPSKRYLSTSRFYQETKLETKVPEYTEQEAASARLLASAEPRAFMLKLAQVGKTRATDAATDLNRIPIDTFLTHGLIRKEYLVLCRKDSHTICAGQDSTELSSGPGADFVCTVCGRPFRDELIHEIYALSDKGKRLLSGSQWMTIWITDLLVQSGLDKEQIAWNPVSGEDELDIMTDALGPRVFFELKDREFGLGDAYPFLNRVSRYGGAFGIVVTSDRVAEEANKFFDEQAPSMGATIISIAGSEATNTYISQLVDQISRQGVFLFLSELAEWFPLDPVPILNAWMNRISPEPLGPNDPLQLTVGAAAELGH